MGIAALVTWLITALGGFFLLYTWISNGGPRKPSSSHFPPALIFGHFALAAIGLVLWIIYLIVDNDTLAWIAFVLLLPMALLLAADVPEADRGTGRRRAGRASLPHGGRRRPRIVRLRDSGPGPADSTRGRSELTYDLVSSPTGNAAATVLPVGASGHVQSGL